MSERILIVDDHPLTRGALSALLAGNGFDVVGEAGDGYEAIERTRELLPDLVLLDLTMPELDGLAALPILRETAPACEVVVLAVCATNAERMIVPMRSAATRAKSQSNAGTATVSTAI